MIVPNPALEHVYITTISGVNVGSPGHFRPEQVDLRDIIRPLSMLVRYNGHLSRFYSVAEHSVWVARLAVLKGDDEAIIPALLHDAHEAYIGDVARPHKVMVPEFAEFEDQMQTIVRDGLGLPDALDPVWGRVAQYDTAMLHREVTIFHNRTPSWYDAEMDAQVPVVIRPEGFDWPDAESFFRSALRDFGFRMPRKG